MLKNVNKIRNSVNTFDDAEFVSLVSENQVLVRNENNNAEWVVTFTEDEKGILKFDGTTAKQVREGDKNEKEIFESNVADLKQTMKAVFSEDHKEAVRKLKTQIFNLPFYEEKEEAVEAEEPVLVSEGRIDAVSTIFEKFSSKVEASDKMFDEFISFGRLFNEDGDVKADNEIIDPSMLLEAYEAKQEQRSTLSESIEETVSFEESVKERYDNEDVVQTILETVEPHSAKVGVQITKALVTAKTKFDNDIVLADERKFLSETYAEAFPEQDKEIISETFSGHTVDNVYNTLNTYPKFKFLKFRTNIYERADVDALTNELERVMHQSYHSLDPDEFQFVNELYSRMMYMTKTNQIDDELVTETIKTFNKRFKGDYKSNHQDPDKALGWKSAAQQGEANAGGDHNPMGVEGI